jgi:hypothetical protein
MILYKTGPSIVDVWIRYNKDMKLRYVKICQMELKTANLSHQIQVWGPIHLTHDSGNYKTTT